MSLFLSILCPCAIYSAHDKQLYLFNCQQNETTMLLAPFLGVTWENYSPIPVNPCTTSSPPPELKILYETLSCSHKRGVALIKLQTCSRACGVSESTLIFYAAGKIYYLIFCSQFNCCPLPVTEATFLRVTEATFLRVTAHLASLDLSYQTTRL